MSNNKEKTISTKLKDIHCNLSYTQHFVESDDKFTRKARLLQSIRRDQTGAEPGYVENKGVRTYHGNLAIDGLKVNRNFLSDAIYAEAKRRVDNKDQNETIEKKRLFCNLLSSQPMAFNLFCPLIDLIQTTDGKGKLAEVVRELLDPTNQLHITAIYKIGIEFIPAYSNKCLNDKTAMDAYMLFETFEGKKGIIAIETKYTDHLGSNEAKKWLPGLQATQKEGISCLFTPEAHLQIEARRIKLTQVFRNFLLAECVRLYDQEHLDESLSIILAPKDNNSNQKDIKSLEDALTPEAKYKFKTLTLENFVKALQRKFPDMEIFNDFYHRYLDFSDAEALLKE